MPAAGTLTQSIETSPIVGRDLDWGAIIAGGLVAFAISSVFIAFGSAIGLSVTSFEGRNSVSMPALLIAAALWFLWIQVSSFLAGGYVAGRMGHRRGDPTRHEAEIRDGTHGLVVWALAVVMGAAVAGMLTVSGLSGSARSNITDYEVEKMLRSSAASTPAVPTDTSQVSHVLIKNLGSTRMDDADKTYLVNEISARAAVPQAEAQARLEQAVAALKSQADSARRFGVLAAFLTAASLLLGAVAAWWAATTGGRHRNEAIDHTHLTRWR